MERFQRALFHIDKITEIVAICLFVALTGIVGIEVFRRYLIGVSFPWSDELARYLMIWVAFLGIGLGCRRERHVGFFVIVNLLPQGLRGVISIFLRCSIIVFLTLVGLGFYRILPVLAIETSPSLGISMFWFYLAVPVMCLLYVLHIIVSLIQDLHHEVQGGNGKLSRKERVVCGSNCQPSKITDSQEFATGYVGVEIAEKVTCLETARIIN